MPRFDVKLEGVGVRIPNVESTLNEAFWVWMATLTDEETYESKLFSDYDCGVDRSEYLHESTAKI